MRGRKTSTIKVSVHLVFSFAVAAPGCVFAREPMRARHAMVVTVEKHATDAGAAVLQSGGNAVDAAVAVAFTLAVTHPSAGNLGGGGFMLLRMADGRATFIDFRERAPGTASHDMYLDADRRPTKDSQIGYRASGIPGTVAGMAYAHEKFGKKPWKDLVQPAVDIAKNGFPVSWGLANMFTWDNTTEKLSAFPESKRIFLKDGAMLEAGDLLVQPELAATLERIRDHGADDFYRGQTARMLAADMQAHGGLITEKDLADYKVIERQPLTGFYHGHTIVTAPPPSSGGVGILQMTGILDGTDYARTGAGSARELHYVAEAMRRFFADRSQYMGDPEFNKVPVTELLDPHYLATLRASIQPDKATPSSEVRPGQIELVEGSHTTHYSIVDAAGNAASVTYTLNDSFGSGVTPAKLGFLMNDEMDDFAPKPGEPNGFGLIQGEANSIAPHKTPLSSMSPTMLVRDGKLEAVMGTPGGPTIINSVLQVALNIIDFGMNAQEAVDQPRIHEQWMPDRLQAEMAFSPDTIHLLEGYGYDVQLRRHIGEMAVILIKDGWLEGAPDGRTEGTAKGF